MTIAPNTPPKPEMDPEEFLAQFNQPELNSADVTTGAAADAIPSEQAENTNTQSVAVAADEAQAGKKKRVKTLIALGTAVGLVVGGGVTTAVVIASNAPGAAIENTDNTNEDLPTGEDNDLKLPSSLPSPSDIPTMPTASPSPVESAAPSESAAPVETVEEGNGHTISGELVTDKDIATRFLEIVNDWQNYGEDQGGALLTLKSQSEPLFYSKLEEIAIQGADEFAKEFFIEGWRDVPSLVEMYEYKISRTKETLELKTLTTGGVRFDLDQAIYRTNIQLIASAMMSESQNYLVIDITDHLTDNHELNRVGEGLTVDNMVVDDTATNRVTFQRVSDSLKVASVERLL